MSVRPHGTPERKNVQGMLKNVAEKREALQILVNIMNGILRLSYS